LSSTFIFTHGLCIFRSFFLPTITDVQQGKLMEITYCLAVLPFYHQEISRMPSGGSCKFRN